MSIVFIDKYSLFFYNVSIMQYKLKDVTKVLTIPKIANVHFFEFPKGYVTEADRHPFCELLFTYSGSMHVLSDGYTGKLRKNEMLIHRANETHALQCKKSQKTTVVIIGFVCDCPALLPLCSAPIRLDESEEKTLSKIVKEGRNVFEPPYDIPLSDMKKKGEQVFGSEQLLISTLENFLIELIRKRNFLNKQTTTENVENNFHIDEVTSYLDQHFVEPITLDELAFMFQINRSALCAQFKHYTGKPIIAYVADKKLDEAKRLLCHTNKTVTEIANELKFDSTAYFCRFFKKHEGVSPNVFREEHK